MMTLKFDRITQSPLQMFPHVWLPGLSGLLHSELSQRFEESKSLICALLSRVPVTVSPGRAVLTWTVCRGGVPRPVHCTDDSFGKAASR